MEFIDKIIEFFNSHMGTMVTIGVVVMEVLLRVIKSSKIRSILRIISAILNKVSQLIGKIAEFLDAIIPDRVPNGDSS